MIEKPVYKYIEKPTYKHYEPSYPSYGGGYEQDYKQDYKQDYGGHSKRFFLS